jgi:hypothetical protein
MTDEPADRNVIGELARNPLLIDARLEAASGAAAELRVAGRLLHTMGALFGDGRTSGLSVRGNGDDEKVGVGVLAQIAADLLEASASHLCGTNHYAGAALLRQVVEVEYLTWAFANQKRDAAAWLNSSHQERLDFFSPARLRQVSDGQFAASDYRHHCEHGGHPVPKAIPLLGNPDVVVAQMLLLDLLLHSWRTTDNLVTWEQGSADGPDVRENLLASQQRFASWGRADPLYQWSLTAPPAPPPLDAA